MRRLPALFSALGLLWAASPPPPLDCEPPLSSDLYCITLFATDLYRGASGVIRMEPPDSPFGVSVTRDGVHRHELVIDLRDLPRVTGSAAYVAWATTPLLRPRIRLGEVRNGETRLGPVALNQMLVLITLERPGTDAPSTLVLRGTSPSVALQPHELPAMLSAAAAGAAAPEGDRWSPPPAYPGVPRLTGLSALRPPVGPYLPHSSEPAPPATPMKTVVLADGDTLALVAGPVARTIGDRTFRMFGFNGQIPGPLLRVDRGSTIHVRFVNATPLPTTVHWHGIRLDNRFDGVPDVTQPIVEPGASFDYTIRFPDAGLYWYHPHHREDIAQDLGLYGNIRVGTPAGDDTDVEAVLMLDDLLVGPDGLVAYGDSAATHALMGRFGNVLLVNGEPRVELDVDRGTVARFYLTNVSNTRTFNLSFGDERIRVVGADLSPFERETWAESVPIAPAERYIVDVRFDRPGPVPITNRVQAIDPIGGRFFGVVDTLGVVRVGESAAEPRRSDDRPEAPLRTHDDVVADIDRYRAAFDRPPDRELVLTVEAEALPFPLAPLIRLERVFFNPVEWSGTMGRMNWALTADRVHWILRDAEAGTENEEIDWRYRVGDVVKIRLRNDRDAFHAMQHPIHLHGQRLLVVARDGSPRTNLAWKDTVLVPAGATADILIEFSNPGQWMLHCHIAEHLEAGMKMIIVVEDESREGD